MATSTIKATREAITSMINVNTIGTKISLSKPINAFKTIAIRVSSDTDLTTGGGPQYLTFPVGDAANQIGLMYTLNGKIYAITLQINSMTELEIIGAYNLTDRNNTMAGGIRKIIGIN